MFALNELEAAASVSTASTSTPEFLAPVDVASFIKLLHPFAPHMAQELWSLAGNDTYLDFEPWPEYDPKLIIEETITLVFQVNGKVRDSARVEATITEDAAKKLALENTKVKIALAGQEPKRVIYVDKKLVNIVI